MSENKCWEFTNEGMSFLLYRLLVHCHRNNIQTVLCFWQNRGKDPVKKGKQDTFLQKIPVPVMMRVPMVCAGDVCTAGGSLSCAAGKLCVTTPGSTIWIEYQCGNLLMPHRLLRSARGYSRIFMPKTLRYTLLLQYIHYPSDLTCETRLLT